MTQKLFILAIFLVTAHTALSLDGLPVRIEECKKEAGYTGDIRKLDLSAQDFPKDVKCIFACSMKKEKVMKEDGTVDQEVTISNIEKLFKGDEKEKFIKAIKSCFSEVKTSPEPCENAFRHVKCSHEKVSKN